ncbi:MAG: molecular chaperone DnaJ [Candidatus Sericytochromatia bacterium]|nr:molecular chaperone DnaJ [Candidatus Sericytochromatia bacterium]
MAKRDYYEILGVTKRAGEAELKKSYRALARQYHPDVNKTPEAEAMFKEISEAYEVLNDPQKRAAYDQYGHAAFTQGGGGAGSEGFGGAGFGFSDIFEAFFGGAGGGAGGGRRGPAGPERGSDLRLDLEVGFRDAIFGAERETNISHLAHCDTCTGTGAAAGTTVETCTTCRGMGQVQQTQRTPFGSFTQVAACPKCQGEGKVAEKPCGDCRGQGRKKVHKQLKIKIPAGVDTGARLRVNGEGDAGGRRGPSGDLYVVLFVLPDPEHQFERRDTDLFIEVAIDYTDAALGAEIEIPTMEGTTKITVPAGTQPGTVFRLKGKGVPHLGDSRRRGDLHVAVQVAVPTQLSSDESKLLKSLAALRQRHGIALQEEPEEEPTAKKAGESSDKRKKDEDDSGFLNVLRNALGAKDKG